MSSSLLILTLIAVLLMLANTVRSQPVVQVTRFEYDPFTSDSEDLIYAGDAWVPQPLTLIKTESTGLPRTDAFGRVTYAHPIVLYDYGQLASFQTEFQFSISTLADVTPGEGLTFFVAPSDGRWTAGGGKNLGIFDPEYPRRRIFAVEFDLHSDSDVGDPPYPHMGIDFRSPKSVNVTRFERAVGKNVTVRIEYMPDTGSIEAEASYGSETAAVSYVRHLKEEFPRNVWVGISASVGSESAQALFDVYKWKFTSILWGGAANVKLQTTTTVM